MAPASVEVPEQVRQQIRAKAEQIRRRMKEPGARLVIVGYADKCFEGPPPLADQYNLELSKRRARAMLKALKEELGDIPAGVDVTIVGMGRRCASSACVCSTPEMPECTNDRKVDLFIDHGETRDFECTDRRYWLAR
ncbi:MAG: hypothetical protein D6806_12815 [Deltaproteobacteria bacterium]|nr:MAG: hypothetical protein D6806_12815 [Deltaproteobacteria bacterium]